jgi:protein O-mannosyl-transferase
LSASRNRLALALLLLITAVCCWPAIDAPFTFDETGGLVDNRALRPGAPASAALAYHFSPDQARPLFFLSLWADAQLFGLTPRPFRLTNLALHLLCGLLVYLLLRRLHPGGTGAGATPAESAADGAALAGTALFLLHPLQSESVIYTWGRSEVLSTLLGLAAILLVPFRRNDGGDAGSNDSWRGALAWAGALFCLGLSLAAKEETVVMPLVAFLFWAVAEGRPAAASARRATLLAVPVVAFVVARWLTLGAAGRQVYIRSVSENLLGQGVVALRMVCIFFLPVGQSVDHAAAVPPLAIGLLALLFCAGLLASAALLLRRQTPEAAAGVLIVVAGSLIYFLVPLPDLMSERRAYLPMVGAAMVVAGLARRIALGVAERRTDEGARERARVSASHGRLWVAFVPAVVLTLLLAPAMTLRARVWSDSRRLWEEAAGLAQDKARPLVNLGVLAAQAGRTTEAASLFDRALALEPKNGEALFNRAKLRLDAGDVKGAVADLEKASAVAPARVINWINLGIARIRTGDLGGAERSLQSALQIDPGEPRALANLAEVLRATGRSDEALPLYRQAMAADPGYAWAAIRLGVALEAAGDRRGALDAYREALARGPATPADREAILAKVAALEAAVAAPRGGPAPLVAPAPTPRPR